MKRRKDCGYCGNFGIHGYSGCPACGRKLSKPRKSRRKPKK